jgi:hypothetical protein
MRTEAQGRKARLITDITSTDLGIEEVAVYQIALRKEDCNM